MAPGTEVYEGMIVGENARDNDMTVNPCRVQVLNANLDRFGYPLGSLAESHTASLPVASHELNRPPTVWLSRDARHRHLPFNRRCIILPMQVHNIYALSVLGGCKDEKRLRISENTPV